MLPVTLGYRKLMAARLVPDCYQHSRWLRDASGAAGIISYTTPGDSIHERVVLSHDEAPGYGDVDW
jgi:hypothetical protein